MQNAININITVLFFIKAPFCYSACPIFQKQSKLPYLFLPIMFSCLLFFIYISLFKNTAIYMGFPIHMTVFPCVCQLTYLANCLIPAGCLGWCRQYIHLLPAAAFTELRATFSKIVAVIFFFLLPGI